jgi:hypothetical protein
VSPSTSRRYFTSMSEWQPASTSFTAAPSADRQRSLPGSRRRAARRGAVVSRRRMPLARLMSLTQMVVAVVAAGLAATSGILSVALIPLALLRLWGVRGWAARSVSVVYLAGMAMQLTSLVVGVSVPVARVGHYSPVWALKEYAITAVPRSLFGEFWLGGPKVDVGGVPTADYYTSSGTQVILIVVGLALLAAVVGCALLRITRPHWPLAILAGLFSIAIFAESSMIMGVVEPRYVIPPALLLYVSIVAMLRPRDGARRLRSLAPVLAFAVLLAVAATANYRVDNARSGSPAWRDKAREAVLIPCDRLRPARP